MASQNGSEIDDILSIINERQQISYNELGDVAFNRGISERKLRDSLLVLEEKQLIASRSAGGVMMYYLLQQNPLRKVLIVEDDKNINKLMALSIGKELRDKPALRRRRRRSRIIRNEQAGPGHTRPDAAQARTGWTSARP